MIRRLLAVLAAVGSVALPVLAVPAAAQDTGWVITSFDTLYEVRADGAVDVLETIAVDFGDLQKHGLLRDIPVLYGYDDTHIRVTRLSDLRVTAGPGTPADVERDDSDGWVHLRIGDPDVTISGAHEYHISYTLTGLLNSFDTHEELYANATGTDWPVPIERASAAVYAPGRVDRVACFAGSTGADRLCDSAEIGAGGRRATFTAAGLGPGEGLTVVAAMAPGSVDVPPPVLRERPAFGPLDARLPGTGHVATAVGLTLAGLIAVSLLVWRQGRDEQTATGRRPLFTPAEGGVEYRPPEGLRPAQLGFLVDEHVDERDISATIVDLAVRGHLTIEEIEKSGWFGRTDWKLTRRDNPAETLNAYEQRLKDALFASGDEVRISELKGDFSTEYQEVRDLIERDGVRQRWFARRPSTVRATWIGAGLATAALGGVLAFWAASSWRLDLALLAVPLGLIGLLLAGMNRWMPRRSPTGSAMLRRALGFREFIRTAETDRMAFAEREELFVEYLPYAVAYDAVDRWAQAFAGLSTTAATTSAYGTWYSGADPTWNLARLSGSLSDFGARTGSSLATTPASSGSSGFSGGFSGGGGGGGGGGSW